MSLLFYRKWRRNLQFACTSTETNLSLVPCVFFFFIKVHFWNHLAVFKHELLMLQLLPTDENWTTILNCVKNCAVPFSSLSIVYRYCAGIRYNRSCMVGDRRCIIKLVWQGQFGRTGNNIICLYVSVSLSLSIYLSLSLFLLLSLLIELLLIENRRYMAEILPA